MDRRRTGSFSRTSQRSRLGSRAIRREHGVDEASRPPMTQTMGLLYRFVDGCMTWHPIQKEELVGGDAQHAVKGRLDGRELAIRRRFDDVVDPPEPPQGPKDDLPQQTLVSVVVALEHCLEEGIHRSQGIESPLDDPGRGDAHVVLSVAPNGHTATAASRRRSDTLSTLPIATHQNPLPGRARSPLPTGNITRSARDRQAGFGGGRRGAAH